MREIPGFDQAPYIGALMRIGLEMARNRILEALAAAGLDDLNLSYVALFQYPPLDGQRPSDIAKRLRVTKQALNHLLGQLEKLGYVERRSDAASRQASIHYTERGWQVLEIIIATMQRLEADWRAKIGDERFAEFKATMKELTGQ
ncbi:MarR family winged helix-turn-helix transcriptional regulator [Asticcacaulis solisilvae]|uniref:MarR family winged helix-turn-helix transcriptional regulator n=1 Tax=Asticcacaulis solisilvae TaxID=1217274 RepID=UPI003FD8E19F